MFKFARYFFIVFLLTTVTPLVLLFFWNHHQMQNFKNKMDQHMLDIHIDELKAKVNSFETLDKVDFKELHPGGPFILEVYKDGKLIEKVHPRFFRKHKPPFMKKFPRKHQPEKRKNLPTKTLQLFDTNGKPTILFSLKHLIRPDKKFLRKKALEPGYIILGAGLLLSLIVGLYVNNIFIKPLFAIAKGAKRIQQGDLDFQLDIKSSQSEIKQTLENFNKMINELKEKEELKNSFIENLSHDLKTPLIAQERALELIANEFKNAGMDEQFQLAKGLERNNKHLLKMANAILESYRIDSEEININISGINLYELVDNCYEKLALLASEKKISLINAVTEDFPVIKSDLTSLKRVLINLISNSIENIPENSEIKIQAKDMGQEVFIAIEDNGQGISKEDMEHIFDRYYSGKSDERKIGSGLGLYVCKRLLEMIDGEITVESEKDKFTRFIVKLPKETKQ